MTRTAMLGLALAAAALLLGCGNYKATFHSAEVINAWGEDRTREQLDIDIVCLTKEDAEKLPEVVSGSLRSDEWFRMRDADDPRLATLKASQIFALRHGSADSRRDTLRGPPLLSGIDRKDGSDKVVVSFKHPQFLNSDAAIVIYARFVGETGLARSSPIIVRPPPGWLRDNNLVIRVGRTSMSCENCP